MQLVDYTHPKKIPALRIPIDRRAASLYLRLDELPDWHPYHSYAWALFRYPEWLEGGAAWLQASYMLDDLQRVKKSLGTEDELRPVIGSGDIVFDDAIAQVMLMQGFRPFVAELVLRPSGRAAAIAPQATQ